LAKHHLLLVEREAKTRRLLKVSLEQAGYSVTTARDGADALAKLELATPALVLSATSLPKLDGYALVRRMKENAEWSRIPVIFMVAGESIEDKIRGLELGVEDYLTKPIFVKELLARVAVLLAKRVRRHLSTSVAQTRVQGSLRDLPTIDLLESLETGQQTGVLRISWGDRVGEVTFEDGEIIDARMKRLRGEEVVFRLLCWTEGRFEVELGDIEAERIIESGTRGIIEAGMRHAADYNRLLAELPSQHTVLEVDQAALAERMGDIPGELDGILGLLDGRRSILDVIDESPFDDISTLQTIAKLHGEGLLRRVVGIGGKSPTIPGPPRTPFPPEESYDDDDDDWDDQLPTMRPPKVSAHKQMGVGQRVAHVVPAQVDDDARETVVIDPPAPTPGQGLAPSGDEQESGAATGDDDAPVTPPRGAAGRAESSRKVPASIPPDTADVDSAFAAAVASDRPYASCVALVSLRRSINSGTAICIWAANS
jgi:DNA-binding response OmpR family regulator